MSELKQENDENSPAVNKQVIKKSFQEESLITVKHLGRYQVPRASPSLDSSSRSGLDETTQSTFSLSISPLRKPSSPTKSTQHQPQPKPPVSDTETTADESSCEEKDNVIQTLRKFKSTLDVTTHDAEFITNTIVNIVFAPSLNQGVHRSSNKRYFMSCFTVCLYLSYVCAIARVCLLYVHIVYLFNNYSKIDVYMSKKLKNKLMIKI